MMGCLGISFGYDVSDFLFRSTQMFSGFTHETLLFNGFFRYFSSGENNLILYMFESNTLLAPGPSSGNAKASIWKLHESVCEAPQSTVRQSIL
jgi:hypothetical protein